LSLISISSFFKLALSIFFFLFFFCTSLVRTRSRWTRRGRATAHSLCSFRTMGAYCTRVVCRRMRRWPTRVSSVALNRRKSRRCVHFPRGSVVSLFVAFHRIVGSTVFSQS
jgi:hypothetical protein